MSRELKDLDDFVDKLSGRRSPAPIVTTSFNQPYFGDEVSKKGCRVRCDDVLL